MGAIFYKNKIYGSGGGGSGGAYTRTSLWTGSVQTGTEITLSDNIENYDALEFITKINTNGAYNCILVDAKTFSTKYPYASSVSVNIPHYCLLGYDNLFGRVITGSTTSKLYVWDMASTLRLVEVSGIKYGSSGGGSGGGNAITYGTSNPTESGNDGDLHIILNSNGKKRGEYLYETNAWVLIDGKGAFDGTIYDEGEEYIDISIGSTGSGSGGTKNADNISINTGGGTFTNYAITDEAVDVTNYDVLHVKCHYRSQDYDQELDISSYSGNKYISFTYLTDSSHNECAVGLSDTKVAATTFRIDSRNGGDGLQSMSYLALEISE